MRNYEWHKPKLPNRAIYNNSVAQFPLKLICIFIRLVEFFNS